MPRRVPANFAAPCLAAALTQAALAQTAITIDVDQPTLLPGESTSVTLTASFPTRDWAMAGVLTDFVTSVGSEGWSDASVVAPMNGPGTVPGASSVTGWDGIIAGQIQFHDIFADPTNPITFWTINYTAPTDVAVPFDVALSTMTNRYDVYIRMYSGTSESRLAELTEGAATIRVIPTPASIVVLALGAACVRRRR